MAGVHLESKGRRMTTKMKASVRLTPRDAHEKLIREEIAAEIMAIDLSEAKAISSDYFAGAIRMRTVASIVAKNGLGK